MSLYLESARPAITRLEQSLRWGSSHPHNNGKAAGPSGPRCVSGQYLAKNHLDSRARARLAADLIEGRAVLGKLTAKQIIQICRANAPYVAEARKSPPVVETLAETLAAATPQELARELGAHKLWEILEHATA
jgi:hypothetical protein